LFKHVLLSEGIVPKRLIHYGTHVRADVRIPRTIGITTNLYDKTKPSEFEQIYLEENNFFSQLVAGTSKIYRILYPEALPQAFVGAGLAGPMFYGFIWDVLMQSRERGIRRLYFIARDGMIFLRIAQAIVSEYGLDLDLRYLYGSRVAFRLPSMFEISPREHRWLTERIPMLSLSMLAQRLNMTGDILRALLPEPLRKRLNDLNASMPESLVSDVLEQFNEIPAIREAILANASRARELLIAYLVQEGFFDDGYPVGTIDIGWMGGSQDSLYKIAASHKSDIEVHGFYFGLFHYSQYTSMRNRKTAYAIRPNHTEENLVALHTELLAQADHGQTIGYERRPDGRVVPTLRDDGEHLREWGITAFLEGAEWFATEYSHIASRYSLLAEHFDAIVPKLLSIMRNPSLIVAKTLGSIPYSGDHCDIALRESAPALDLRSAFFYSFLLRYEKRRLMTEWYKASLVRSKPLAQLVLRLHPFFHSFKFFVKYLLLNLARRLRGL
jgi:hypothetical protein